MCVNTCACTHTYKNTQLYLAKKIAFLLQGHPKVLVVYGTPGEKNIDLFPSKPSPFSHPKLISHIKSIKVHSSLMPTCTAHSQDSYSVTEISNQTHTHASTILLHVWQGPFSLSSHDGICFSISGKMIFNEKSYFILVT